MTQRAAIFRYDIANDTQKISVRYDFFFHHNKIITEKRNFYALLNMLSQPIAVLNGFFEQVTTCNIPKP